MSDFEKLKDVLINIGVSFDEAINSEGEYSIEVYSKKLINTQYSTDFYFNKNGEFIDLFNFS